MRSDIDNDKDQGKDVHVIRTAIRIPIRSNFDSTLVWASERDRVLLVSLESNYKYCVTVGISINRINNTRHVQKPKSDWRFSPDC